MREKVFSDATARERLEDILHPLIRLEAERRIATAVAPYVLLVVPLLLETGKLSRARPAIGYWSMDVSVEMQITRTMERSSLTREAVAAITAAQIDRQSRLAAADDVIDNNVTSCLRAQVERLHAAYVRLAADATDR